MLSCFQERLESGEVTAFEVLVGSCMEAESDAGHTSGIPRAFNKMTGNQSSRKFVIIVLRPSMPPSAVVSVPKYSVQSGKQAQLWTTYAATPTTGEASETLPQMTISAPSAKAFAIPHPPR